MRDAFGGAFMIKLFLVFIIIYVSFTAIALNYAKAFKVKNKVIEYIESNEITNIKNMPASEYNIMDEYFEKDVLGAMNYKSTIDCTTPDRTGVSLEYCENGIRIYKIDPETSNNTNKLGIYYKVDVSIGWSIPFINSLLNLSGRTGNTATGNWIISGETRPIVNSR